VEIREAKILVEDLQGGSNWYILEFQNPKQKLTLAEATKKCKSFGEGWRLPTRIELEYLLRNQFNISNSIKSYWTKDQYNWGANGLCNFTIQLENGEFKKNPFSNDGYYLSCPHHNEEHYFMAVRTFMEKHRDNEAYKYYAKDTYKIKYAKGGGVYSSDTMYELKVFDGKSNEFLTSVRYRARSQREANEIGQDYEYEMQQKYGDYLRFVVSEAKPLMAEGGGVDEEKIWEIIYKDRGVQKSILVEGYSHILEENNWRNKNPTKEFIQIRLYGNKHSKGEYAIDGQNWFLEKIDTTHFYMSRRYGTPYRST
jgi:hypothetical protein